MPRSTESRPTTNTARRPIARERNSTLERRCASFSARGTVEEPASIARSAPTLRVPSANPAAGCDSASTELRRRWLTEFGSCAAHPVRVSSPDERTDTRGTDPSEAGTDWGTTASCPRLELVPAAGGPATSRVRFALTGTPGVSNRGALTGVGSAAVAGLVVAGGDDSAAGDWVESTGGVGAGVGAGAGVGDGSLTGGGGGVGVATDGAGAGFGAGGGAGGAIGGGAGVPRAGSRVSGSTYVSRSPTRTPMCTYGTSCSGSPDVPESATASPSSTGEPRLTSSRPRCVSDDLWPSRVTIVTVKPCVGTCPANVTSPDTGARIACPPTTAMSTPRCCPPAYGLSPMENARSTAPSAGQAHAHAPGVQAKNANAAVATTTGVLVVREANMDRR